MHLIPPLLPHRKKRMDSEFKPRLCAQVHFRLAWMGADSAASVGGFEHMEVP